MNVTHKNKMKNLLLILISLMISTRIFGTAQIPDLLIYNDDTLSLYANPLESYFNEDNPRPGNIGGGGCWSTACWRGYQAIWEIKDHKLYLNSITDCCFWEKYIITTKTITKLSDDLPEEVIQELEKIKDKQFDSYDFKNKLRKKLGKKTYRKYEDKILSASLKPKSKADLTKLFPNHVVDDKVFAFWFTGDLTIPRGKMLEYVHMGYMSKYEKELVLSIENGNLIDAIEYENKTNEIQKGFGILQATSFSIVVPLGLISNSDGYEYTMTDTINYTNENETISLSAFSKFNEERKESRERIILVESTIDSLVTSLTDNYIFSDKITQKLRWGTGCWIDGVNVSEKESIRIFTMSNINSQLTIKYIVKDVDSKDFKEEADYVIYSIRLMEFGF